MTAATTHYASLKVARDAPDFVIRAAYRALAQKHHPDKNPGDENALRILKTINHAYTVLSDPLLRAQYDEQITREESLRANRGTPPNPRRPPESPSASSSGPTSAQPKSPSDSAAPSKDGTSAQSRRNGESFRRALGWTFALAITLLVLTATLLPMVSNSHLDAVRNQPIAEAPEAPPLDARAHWINTADPWERLVPDDHPALEVVRRTHSWTSVRSSMDVEMFIDLKTFDRREDRVTFWEAKQYLAPYAASPKVGYSEKLVHWTLNCAKKTYSWATIIELNEYGRITYIQDFANRFVEKLKPGSDLEWYHSEFCRNQPWPTPRGG